MIPPQLFSFVNHRLQRLGWTAVLFVSVMGATPTEARSRQARSADAFVDSIGITVHLEHKKGVYAKHQSIVVPRLQTLGIRHIRAAIWANDFETQRKIQGLGQLGIKSLVVMDPVRGITPSEATKIVKNLSQSIEAVEGPNEWDILRFRDKLRYKGRGFPDGLREFQAELYTALKNDPATQNMPVLAPSLINMKNASLLGRVECDFNNIHSYPRGQFPGSKSLERHYLSQSKTLCGEKPVIATETGYHNALNHKPRSRRERFHSGISEQISAKYIPRLLLEYFERGVERTYIYELIDRKPNPKKNQKLLNFGLVRNDGSPKPAYFAVKNLLQILSDSQTQQSIHNNLGKLNYSISGDVHAIRHTLLQKRNGRFYLILWQEVPSIKNRLTLSVPAKPLALNLNTPTSQATLFRPVTSALPIATHQDPVKINIQVTDDPLIIEISPLL